MAILNVKTESVGHTGVTPRIIYIDTNNTEAEVQATGFLNGLVKQGFDIRDSDLAAVTVKTAPNATATTVGIWEVQKSGDDYSLTSTASSPTTAITPTVADALAYFDDTAGIVRSGSDAVTHAGSLSVTGDIESTAGDVKAGSSGNAGTLESYPATTARGTLQVVAADNDADYFVRLTNAPHGQDTTYTVNDVGEATASILTATLDNSDPNANIVTLNGSASSGFLAAGGTATIAGLTSTGSYRMLDITLRNAGTDFSGGGGDRDIEVYTGSTSITVIPAATCQALVNAKWGSSDVPFDGTADALATFAGTNPLRFRYSGGTTDYTAGSIQLVIMVERLS